MKVKIGDRVFDDRDQPIMLILNQLDRLNIAHLPPNATQHLRFPDWDESARRMRNEGEA